jgi:GTPase SAR1 family protein
MSTKQHDNIATLVHNRARPILDLVDELRSMGVDKDVPIPQIAVMGDQSSGKSSVLEALSGIAFPRGAGLVTRCPTQVNMSSGIVWKATVSCPALPEMTRELSEQEKDEIPKFIESVTKQLAGNDNGFPDWKDQNNYILVEVVSPKTPDLTIIDLPGIVRTLTEGQETDTIATVDAMLKHFLDQPRTCILAVLPANVDLAVSEILQRASKVDPTGSRTIGVLTKPDLVDKGAEDEVIKILTNVKRPLQHGYFMLKNRSQDEVGRNISFKEARQSEIDFFANSPYADVAQENLGIQALSSALTDLLVHRIEIALPEIKTEVQQVLDAAQKELLELGQAPPEDSNSQRLVFSSVVREILHDMRVLMTGAVSHDGKSNEHLLNLERIKRKAFAVAVLATKPGFGGEHDKFDFEVLSVGTGTLNDGVEEKKVGDVMKNRHWTNKKSTTKLRETAIETYATAGCKKSMVVQYKKYYRGDLCKLIEARRGREL